MKFSRPFLFFLFCLFVILPSCLSNDEDKFTSLVEKGEVLIKQGSYPAGIAVLETVLNQDPSHTQALNSLLKAYDTYSQKLIAQNRFDQAQSYLTKMEEMLEKIGPTSAIEFSSESSKAGSRIKREAASAKTYLLNTSGEKSAELISLNAGRERYNEAVQKFSEHRYDEAEHLLKESIELDSTNPYAFELLGEIANLNHKLDEAEAYYKKAFSLNPTSALRAKYEKLTREKGIDKMRQQYEDEHFIIRYRRSENLEGSKIREYLRGAYRTISQELGYYPSYKIPVLLYDREEYQTLLGSVPHWSGALFDGKIRIPVYEGAATESDLKKFIHHELTHAFVLDLSQMKCPVWLNEGLAQYQENKVQTINLKPLVDAVRANTLLSVDELMFEDVSKIASQEKAFLFYLESFSLASYLVEHSRWFNVKQFLMELGKGAPFPEAFEKVFGRTFSDFSTEWRRDLDRRYSR